MDIDTDKRKGVRQKSPNAPAYSVQEVLEDARRIFRIENQVPISRESIAEHLGLAAQSGPFNRKLSSLRQYGFLEPVVNLPCSELFLCIDHATDETDRQHALREALGRPAIFQGLLSQYETTGGGLPSDINLTNQLVLKFRFTKTNAETVAKSFLESPRFAGFTQFQLYTPPLPHLLPASPSPLSRLISRKPQNPPRRFIALAMNRLLSAAKKFHSGRVAVQSCPFLRMSLLKKSPKSSVFFMHLPVSIFNRVFASLNLLDPLSCFLHPSLHTIAKSGAMYYLTRLVEFESLSLLLESRILSEENHHTFGKCVSPHGHGHNYVLRVTLAGHSDPRTGMVLNVKELDRILKEVSSEFDHKFINADHPSFHDRIPTTENLASYMRDRIEEKLQAERGSYYLAQVRLYEEPTLWSDVFAGEGRTIACLTKTFGFSAAHRLHSSLLSDEENQTVFGKCNNPNGHGHNYELEVTVQGQLTPNWYDYGFGRPNADRARRGDQSL